MSKRLKIQFWKAEKALAMQILERKGLPKRKAEGNVRIQGIPALFQYGIALGGTEEFDLNISHIDFDTNAERDEYLRKTVNAITNELFTGDGELKIGEMCEVSEDRQHWVTRRLLAILPENYEPQFIVGNDAGYWSYWSYARPITKRTEPTIEECGQLVTYTWEEK